MYIFTKFKIQILSRKNHTKKNYMCICTKILSSICTQKKNSHDFLQNKSETQIWWQCNNIDAPWMCLIFKKLLNMCLGFFSQFHREKCLHRIFSHASLTHYLFPCKPRPLFGENELVGASLFPSEFRLKEHYM